MKRIRLIYIGQRQSAPNEKETKMETTIYKVTIVATERKETLTVTSTNPYEVVGQLAGLGYLVTAIEEIN